MPNTNVKQIEQELAKPANKGVFAIVNEAGTVRAFMAPKPYWQSRNDASDTGKLTAQEVDALTTERDELIASLPRLAKAARSKATTRINIIEGTLRRARANEEADRIDAEREAERPVQRYGRPGNTVQQYAEPVPYFTRKTEAAEQSGPKQIQAAFNTLSADEQKAFAARPMADQGVFIQSVMNEFRRIGATK